MTVQKRIQSLDPYVASEAISEDDIYFALDSSYFPKPLNIPLSELRQTSHSESDLLTSLGSRDIAVTFDTAFTNPVFGELRCYRWKENSAGTWNRENVLWGYTTKEQPNNTGFSIKIDDENLSGVVVDYYFWE
jgi:hypothetical protein